MHEDAKLMPLIPKGPIESSDFLKHVALLRKYEVLAKIEYQPIYNRKESKPAECISYQSKGDFATVSPFLPLVRVTENRPL
ncbi:hypothetical protein CEXT_351461 [Caerostris extrusa]|uniref:Uncharacterized protein n=1 Tax=Caerostris extrusa TaxID=172846 RepID=A0AAV4RIN3_CAEEX|nr:hypothetical protein CEXT_351461 [Caerostris extrusa]